MTALIQFVANDIRLEGTAVDVTLAPEWLDRQLGDARVRARRGPAQGARLTGRLSRSGDDIVVRCRVRAAVEADCVRCLAPSPFDIDAELSLLLQPAPPARPSGNGHRSPHGRNGASQRGRVKPHDDDDDAYEFSADEADVDRYDGETVALDSFVREAILLEMPSFPLCSEGCPGIRPSPEIAAHPDQPDRVDPRLAPLGAFRTSRQRQGQGDQPATVDDVVAAAAERAAALGRPVMRSNTHRSKKKKK